MGGASIYRRMRHKNYPKGAHKMKGKIYLVALFLLLTPILIFSQSVLVNDNFNSMNGWKAAYGNWKIVDGRLAQLSTTAGKAKINRYVPQSGLMQYEFNVRYIDGGTDQYGGFGIHVFVDKPHGGLAWGDGRSFLLWITYDPKAYGGTGFYGQVYKSVTSSYMYMKKGYNQEIPEKIKIGGKGYVYLDPAYAKYNIPIKFTIDSATGEVKLYDPLIPNWVWKFSLGGPVAKGSYVRLRTNSLAVSFDDFKVTKLK